ncbi:MAG TPA: hypothetical protein VGK59_17115, partial [Ohtaekwangia sp.]
DLKFARDNNYFIRLIARSFRLNGKVYGFVAPQFVEANNPLASVRNEYNAVQVQGAFAEKQLFIGKGAGSYPTGSAVLSDLSALSYDYSYEYKKLHQADRFEFSNDLLVEAYISFEEGINISVKDFEKFQSGYAANGKQYMFGQVRLSRLNEWNGTGKIGVILAPNSSFVAVEKINQSEVVYA